MTSTLLQTLWEAPTFANLLRTLPTVLTSSLFLLFGLLELALACLKWTLFLLIIASTVLFGLMLLMISVRVIVGVVMGTVEEGKEEKEEKGEKGEKGEKEEGGVEVQEEAEEDENVKGKVEEVEAGLESDAEGRATPLQRRWGTSENFRIPENLRTPKNSRLLRPSEHPRMKDAQYCPGPGHVKATTRYEATLPRMRTSALGAIGRSRASSEERWEANWPFEENSEIVQCDEKVAVPPKRVTAVLRRRTPSPEGWEVNWPFGENA